MNYYKCHECMKDAPYIYFAVNVTAVSMNFVETAKQEVVVRNARIANY